MSERANFTSLLTKAEILSRLTSKTFGKNLHLFDSVDSTNNFAKSLAANSAPEGTTVVAEFQTHGKGRTGRKWHSSAGMNLTFSVILRPRLSAKNIGLISLYASVSVASTIAKSTSLAPECKWPNDVLIDGHKVCGILSEATVAQDGSFNAIVGIGINVNGHGFPPDLLRPATSLSLKAGRDLDRVEILCRLLRELEDRAHLLDDDHAPQIVASWNSMNRTLGKEVVVDQEGIVTRGISRGIAEDGRLILETKDGVRYIVAGDASFA